MRAVTLLMMSFFTCAVATPALAQNITLQADSAAYFSENNRVELSGNVRVVRGNMHLLADRVVALLKKGEHETIQALGNVQLKQGGNIAQTDTLTYDVPSGKIQMGGTKGSKNISSEKSGVSFTLKADNLKEKP